MGHLLFWILHFFAFMFGFVLLVVTIPLHLIYSASMGSGTRKIKHGAESLCVPTPKTHMRCPDCKEYVLKEANICKHCRCEFEVDDD